MRSHLVNVLEAVLDKVFGGSHQGPRELGQTRPDLGVQNTDVVLEQTHLLPGQQANDPDTQEGLKSAA